jgi:DNA-binding Lrp family transcriptional regulator
VLRQHQVLDAPEAHELIFEARREDFSRPSTEQILQDVGLSPEEVANLLDRVDRDGEASPG